MISFFIIIRLILSRGDCQPFSSKTFENYKLQAARYKQIPKPLSKKRLGPIQALRWVFEISVEKYSRIVINS
jgi:hypothetical protein